jgi:thiol-disulfide isomerase/thioredoxin
VSKGDEEPETVGALLLNSLGKTKRILPFNKSNPPFNKFHFHNPIINVNLGVFNNKNQKSEIMKKELLTIFLFCLVIFVSGQKVIENPKYGLRNEPKAKITRIEITDTETVLSFHLTHPAGTPVGIAAKSYIQVVGQPDTLFMIKKEAPKPDATGWIIIPEGGLSYKLYFPPIDPNVAKIDFGEPVSNSWKFYDIEIGEQPHLSMIPKDFAGNWFSDDNGNWTYSFFEKTAIFDHKTWEYVSVEKEIDFYRIKLKSGKEEKMIYGKPVNETNCMIGDTPASTKKFSREMFRSNNLVSEKFEEPLFNPGTVVYKGFLKGFNTRIGINTGMIRFMNRLTNKQESYLIKLDENGYFEVEFPLDFPQELTVGLPLTSERVFFEPGKTLFHLLNTGDAENPSLFMGENADANTGLSVTSNLKTDQVKIWEGVLEMTEQEYINRVKAIGENERKALNQIQKEKNVDEKVMQIRNLDIDFRMAFIAFQFNQYRKVAIFQLNQTLKKEDQLSFIPAQTNISNYTFLKDIPVNDKIALLSSEYFNLLSMIRFIDFARPQSSYYYIIGLVRRQLEMNGIKLSGEESDMLDFIKINLEENYNDEANLNFSQTYGQTLRSFVQKHQDVYNQVSNQVALENFKTNLKNIFGIEGGLAMDIVNTQIYLASLKPETLNEEEFTKAKSSVKTDYLKEQVISSYYECKAELTVKNTPTEYVPKTEAEKYFDGLIKKYRGKVVYVDFWATWCAPCKDGIARIKPLKEEMANEDIVFVYITNPTSPDKDYQKAIPDIKGEHFKVSADDWNLLTSKFNIYGIPHYALVDKTGRIVNPDLNHLENEPLKKLLLEQVNK